MFANRIIFACFIAFGIVLVIAAVSAGQAAGRSTGPTLPIENPGVCPYECCKYDDSWQSTADVQVRASRSSTAASVFQLLAGERITAVTGVVITTFAPQVRLVRPEWAKVWDSASKRESEFPGRPGDVLYLLAYHGEGNYTAWFRGRIIQSVDGGAFMTTQECADTKARFPDSGCSGEFVGERQIKSEWWVQLRDVRGRSGWALVTRGLFKTPSCG